HSFMARPHFLVTNDDGFRAAGIALLARVAAEVGDVTVVAPDRQQSATAHALSLKTPLRITEKNGDWYAIDGLPTDCVNLALNGLLTKRPTHVLSGINHGANLADDVTYSGT